jgi:hypothetical protein
LYNFSKIWNEIKWYKINKNKKKKINFQYKNMIYKNKKKNFFFKKKSHFKIINSFLFFFIFHYLIIQTCVNSAGNCQSCFNTSSRPFLYQNLCVPECPSNSYLNELTLICEACNENCLLCPDLICTKCDTRLFLLDGSCIRECPE